MSTSRAGLPTEGCDSVRTTASLGGNILNRFQDDFVNINQLDFWGCSAISTPRCGYQAAGFNNSATMA
jgi:hypothetical protein